MSFQFPLWANLLQIIHVKTAMKSGINVCNSYQTDMYFAQNLFPLHQSVQDDSKGWPGDVVSREQPAKGDPQTNFGQECNPSPSRSAVIHMVLSKLYSSAKMFRRNLPSKSVEIWGI